MNGSFRFLENLKSKSTISSLIFCACYLILAIFLFTRLGLIENLHEVIFSTPDSKGYLALSNFIIGKTPSINQSLVEIRPFLFPLYLSIYNLVGAWGYMIIQITLNIVSILFVFNSVRKLTGSFGFSFAAMVLMVSNLTFTFITLHALTETFSIVLIACTVYFMTSFSAEKQSKSLFYALFFLSAATCVKGIFIPFLILWYIFVTYHFLNKGLLTLRRFGYLLIGLTPIMMQMLFAYSITGSPTISKIGLKVFNNRYFPAVYGVSKTNNFTTYSSPIAEEAKKVHPSLREKISFLLENPHATLNVSIYLFKHNILSGSPYVNSPSTLISDRDLGNLLYILSEKINSFLMALHLMAFFAISWLLFSGINKDYILFIVFSMCLIYSILLASIMTYWQGDRIVIAGLPAWSILYPSIGYYLIQDLRKWWRRGVN